MESAAENMACCQPMPLTRVFHTGKDVGCKSERCAPVGLGYKPWAPGVHGEAPGISPLTIIFRSATVGGSLPCGQVFTGQLGLSNALAGDPSPDCVPAVLACSGGRLLPGRAGLETGACRCDATRGGLMGAGGSAGLETLCRCDALKKSHKVLCCRCCCCC